MVDRFQNLAQHIFDKQLHEVSVDEARSLTERFPYFAPAHFLLLKKLEPGSEAYNAQFQKAILYYNDPLVFNSFLHPQQEPAFEEAEVVAG